MNLEDVARDWRPPAGLGQSGPRPVRLSMLGVGLALASVAVLVGGMVLGWVVWRVSRRQDADRRALDTTAVVTQGTVTRVFRTGGKEHAPLVSYEFRVNGSIYTATSGVPSRIWKTLNEGDPIDVRYVPADPTISHPAGWAAGAVPVAVVPIIPLTLSVAAGALGYQIRRQWRLLAEGRAAPGVVTRVRTHSKGARAEYEFRLLNGTTQRGRSPVSRSSSPPVGTAICVLYDPDDPNRSDIYPLTMVRLDRPE